jgi:hypothetical protein
MGKGSSGSDKYARESLELQKKQQAELEAKEKRLKQQQDAALRARRSGGTVSLVSPESFEEMRSTLG